MSVETHDPPAPSNVMAFRPRPVPAPAARQRTTPIYDQLQVSLQAQALARQVFAVDQNLLRAPGDVTLGELRPEIADQFLDRAAIAVHLGDPIKRAIADEQAAIQLLYSLTTAVKRGVIPKDSPLATLDLAMCRVAAKFALLGGLDYLAAREKR